MKRLIAGAAGACLILAAGAVRAQVAPDPMSYVVTGVAAKLACSSVFVSGRELEHATRDPAGLLGPMGAGLTYRLDAEAGLVAATQGGVTRAAHHRPGLGCTLAGPDGVAPQVDPRQPSEPALEWTVVEPGPEIDAAALEAALAAAFPDNPEIDTRAFVVVHDGRIVAERYAPGYDADTALLGWSMSKSVIATLVGLMIEDGRMSLTDTVAMPGWAEDDPRRTITVEQLLHMSSGLVFTEEYAGADDATLMLFTQPDMAGYAAAKPLEHAPGEAWSYASGTTLILSRLLVEAAGGPEALQTYARERLFVPAGMLSAVMEQDNVGTPVGSSYVYATARDWARFGQLYANGGEVDGRRVLPEAWTRYVREPAPAQPNEIYGAQFWLNGFRGADRAVRQFPELPADTFYASGHNGQSVMIIPSLDVVIVRLGWTTGGARYRLNDVVPPVLRALDLLAPVPAD